ncbi:MAG TPA: hypothetical protein VMF03_04040 [Steroidobacteraceae bacterium]|nr:hypothetical protein [Steroidobacteraceae bacterium]
MSGSLLMGGQTRRAFLGGAGMTVAAAVAMSLVPAARAAVLAGGVPMPAALGAGHWHVDDIWGPMPRYADPVPYMHDTTPPNLAAYAAAVDRQFVG